MKNFLPRFGIIAALLIPASAFAATTIQELWVVIGGIVKALIPVAASFGLLMFFWGLAMYLANFTDKDENKKKGKDIMVWGVIALFAMVSVWGLITVLQNTFGVFGGPIHPPILDTNPYLNQP